MIPEHDIQAMRAQVEDLRAEARSLLNEGHKLRARLVSEAADGLARLLEERETTTTALEFLLDIAERMRGDRHVAPEAWYLARDAARVALSASPEEARREPPIRVPYDGLGSHDGAGSRSPEEARDDAERRCRDCNAPLTRNELSICEDCVRDPRA